MSKGAIKIENPVKCKMLNFITSHTTFNLMKTLSVFKNWKVLVSFSFTRIAKSQKVLSYRAVKLKVMQLKTKHFTRIKQIYSIFFIKICF